MKLSPFFIALASASLLVGCGSSSTDTGTTNGNGNGNGGDSSSSSSSSVDNQNGIHWNVYAADYHPTVDGSLTLSDGSATAFALESAEPADADFFTDNGDGTVTFDSSAVGSYRLVAQHEGIANNQGDYPKHLTFVTGMTGFAEGFRLLDIEVALADEGQPGSRLKTIIRADGSAQGVQLERANNDESVEAYGYEMDRFRIYQVAITLTDPATGDVRVYIDGEADPVLELESAALRSAVNDGDNYIRFGDGGSHQYKAELDWLIWTDEAAYSPDELAGKLPANIGCIIGYGDSEDTRDCKDDGADEPVELTIPEPPTPTPHDVIPAGENIYYVATDGNNSDAGSEAAPFATLNHALSQVAPGDVIVMRGGVYNHSSTININNVSGSPENPITIFAYPGETPILDFSSQNIGGNNNGIRLNANYWHLYGLKIRHAGHNGIRMDGSFNRLERLVAKENYDTGIHMAGSASNNLIMNCDSYRNFNDGRRKAAGDSPNERIGNNADGFGAKFPDLGPGNMFYGNRAWENSDDGFDFWRAPHPIVLYNNWTFSNGNQEALGYEGSDFDGGGNGFKLGGNHEPGDHLVYRNMAFDLRYGNSNAAFDRNNNTGALTLIHNTALNSVNNFNIGSNPDDSSKRHVFQNNASLIGNVNIANRSVQEGNSWQLANEPTTGDFVSLNVDLAKSERQADGSLPEIDLLKPKPDSPMVDGGVDIGRPFNGSAPDMGAYEYQP
ncbi:right-handed parallel beta-helix repeat-containing protein [Marinimicrobium alkaliphilum]|uniref:right-handed parallel beta-helix repeat-containing protein n=1 Tax=Marinimicrobium alkaliphilum TaxID=2202654 RepID=UPI000DB9CCA1|nr:right-handed parallel beta-helix repeat-containing protein [Marinimicrobium alkaliphilum]